MREGLPAQEEDTPAQEEPEAEGEQKRASRETSGKFISSFTNDYYYYY